MSLIIKIISQKTITFFVRVQIRKKNLFRTYFLKFFISFPTLQISFQSETWAESYDQNTETCAESKFKSNPILTFIGEISI
jgi:hypothetical protein